MGKGRVSVNCSYSNKENTFSGRKIPLIHLLLSLCHHKRTYSLTCVHKIGMCGNRALYALDAFDGVKTFCWLLALNTTFHKKHCLNLPRAGSSFSHRGKSSFNSVPFLHGPFWKTILSLYLVRPFRKEGLKKEISTWFTDQKSAWQRSCWSLWHRSWEKVPLWLISFKSDWVQCGHFSNP